MDNKMIDTIGYILNGIVLAILHYVFSGWRVRLNNQTIT